ncbi:alpha/beta fold hydrolase, partial [candidate division KSB1 bacterium]
MEDRGEIAMEAGRAGRWGMKYFLRKGARSLVMVHGLGMSGDFFRGAFEFPGFQERGLLAPDLVGFGETPPHPDFDYSMSAQAAAVWSLCDLLGMDRVDLLGHSMGGTVAVCMAKQRPDRVNQLIVAEGNLISEPSVLSARLSSAGEAGAAALWEEIIQKLPIPSLKQTTLPVVVRSAQSLQDTPDR